MDPLQQAVVFCLGDDSEMTLLLLQLINDPSADLAMESPTSEAALIESLAELESEGFVSHRVEFLDAPKPGGAVPEYDEGRPKVVWWQLTRAGELARRRGVV
ncbi:MAG: hypothetical protein KY458_13300 [Actinobacteria bacterium]|nr:hypothetical protein [Actinomycetota bacterium]